jgi:hypothetical protein
MKAAQDERPHHDLGHVGLRGQHPAELAAGKSGDPAVGPHPAAHQDRPVGEEVELSGELVRGVHGHHLRRAV